MQIVWLRFLTVLLVSSSFVFSQNKDDLSAEGTGIGANHDEALLAAKRDAIEKGIGTLLLSQTEIENFMVKRDLVITRTTGAVRQFQIVSESKAIDGTIEIKIKASLSRTAIKEDLASLQILIESMNKPRVMVIISEDNTGSDQPTNRTAENAVVTFLKTPYGFDCIDPSIAQSIRSSRQQMAELAGDVAAAAAIGKQHGAEVLITGSAISRKADNLSQDLGGMVSVQADVTLRAINCTTGRIISTSSEHAAKVHIQSLTAGNQAIAKASEKATAKLLDIIVKEWQNQANNGINLNITVKGTGTFSQKNGVLKALRTISGIGTLNERSWDAQSTMLVVDIQYKGNTDGFCSKLDGLKTGADGSLFITGVTGQQVTVQLKQE